MFDTNVPAANSAWALQLYLAPDVALQTPVSQDETVSHIISAHPSRLRCPPRNLDGYIVPRVIHHIDEQVNISRERVDYSSPEYLLLDWVAFAVDLV